MGVVFNGIGLLGMGLILAAYFMLQRGSVTGHDTHYLWLNVAGAGLIVISLLWFWNLSAFLLESAWMLISAYSLIQVRRKKA